MAESTLSFTFADLYSEVSDFLGTGLTPDGNNLIRAKSRVNDGYRNFLSGVYPGRPAHVWSFLTIESTLTLVTGTYNAALPDAFGHLVVWPKYAPTSSFRSDLRMVGVDEIQSRRQASQSTTGVPYLFAVRSIAPVGVTVSTRFEMLFYPTPSSTFSLTYTYRVVPSKLASDTAVPYGAQMHSDTILEACLAAAEQRQDDTNGEHSQLYLSKLLQSIELDRMSKPQALGYCGDGGGPEMRWPVDINSYNGNVIT